MQKRIKEIIKELKKEHWSFFGWDYLDYVYVFGVDNKKYFFGGQRISISDYGIKATQIQFKKEGDSTFPVWEPTTIKPNIMKLIIEFNELASKDHNELTKIGKYHEDFERQYTFETGEGFCVDDGCSLSCGGYTFKEIEEMRKKKEEQKHDSHTKN